MKPFAPFLIALLCISCAGPRIQDEPTRSRQYADNKRCEGCHVKIFQQYTDSYHAAAFSNPLFQGQYFEELLPKTGNSPELREEARKCIVCHAPAASITLKGDIDSPGQVGPALDGVTCDFCHSIKGFEGKAPGDGNYLSVPDDLKCGPFRRTSRHHAEYCLLPTKSEFCGICHNSVNRHGLEVKSTYTEWKESSYAKEGIQCQDCHMNRKGFLVMGRAIHREGTAARMTVGEAPYRKKLYTHRFPGAHSGTQIAAAATITVAVEKVGYRNRDITFHVEVNNETTGHKMPSGSADLRLLWLEVAVHAGNRIIPVPAAAAGGDRAFDTAGSGPFDREILGNEIPGGSRIYRAVFVDAEGKQTLASYDAVKTIFDNRLNAGEIREEYYAVRVPDDIQGLITLEATLKYIPYPASFSRKFGLEEAEPLVIGAARKTFQVK